MRALRWVGLGILVLVLVAAVALGWLLNTTAGAAWALRQAGNAAAGTLEITEVQGTLAGPLTVRGVRYRDPEGGIALAEVGEARTDVALRALLGGRVHVRELAVSGVRVDLTERTREPEEERPFSLEPPIDMLLDRATLERATIARDGEPLLVVDRAEAAGRWTSERLAVRTLEVRSPQGRISFAGELSGAPGEIPQRQAYIGSGAGRFRWQLGERTYAGTVQLNGAQERAAVHVRLTAPFAAQLDAHLEPQREALPWRFQLQVPRFDPRRNLLPESDLEALAASLAGSGNREEARVVGEVEIGQSTLRLEPLRAAWKQQRIAIRELTLRTDDGAGTLSVSGELRLDAEPLHADLLAQWRDVQLPAELAGQRLATRGVLAVQGSLDAFTAKGDLAAGPPGQLADVALVARGSTEAIELERLDVRQRAGSLTARGRVQLEPRIAWDISAQASDFDPGAFLAEWPGRLGFSLETEGRLTDAGPSARLEIPRLAGRLRDRSVAGEADLTLQPDRVLAGRLELRSGRSSIRLTGERGEQLDVRAVAEVATLDDWLPEAGGSLSVRATVRGTWPALAIDARARGSDIAVGETAVRRFEARASVANLEERRGSARVSARDLTAAGFELASLDARADGSAARHTVELDANGEALTVALALQGSLDEPAWSGVLQRLRLEPQGVPAVALLEPARLRFAEGAFSVSDSCLAGDGARLCLAAEGRPDGALQARYALEELPLALLAALGAPDLPFTLAGTLDGRGEIRREPNGALYGQALITSAAGGVDDPADETEELLRYEKLRIEAALAGDTAQLTARALLGAGGELEARARLTELRTAAPAIEGSGRIVIPDLQPLGALAPQLAGLTGRAEASATVGGTLPEPQLAGELRGSGIGAEIPELGIQLREGTLEGALEPDGRIALAGGIASGDGQIRFDGGATSLDDVRVKITGRQFLAANIPGARVVVAPELTFARTPERLALTGTVTVPRATINLARLPMDEGGPQRISPDVVVVDDEQPVAEAPMPLYADVTIILGENVHLTGFGLDAQARGRLTLIERPGEEPRASGEVRVTGTYEAFGEELTVERGTLAFAATPLDDPRLDLLAVRQLPEVRVELRVTGTAREPQLTVASDPPMPQMEALSYLVTGGPLSQVGQGEGDLLQTAARSLGGAAGNLLARAIGRRIGVDELVIEEDEDIGGALLRIGEYLLPNLYVSYGVGIFEPGQVISLRYLITDRLSVEATQGPRETRAGIDYRVERGGGPRSVDEDAPAGESPIARQP